MASVPPNDQRAFYLTKVVEGLTVIESQSGIDDRELGNRLRMAREEAGITQVDAAVVIDAARTTVVAIEQGKRTPRMQELQMLARAYGTSVNSLLKRERAQISLLPRFRSIVDAHDHALSDATKILHTLVSAELELEDALGVARRFNYPPESPLLPGDVREQAEHDAAELRRWLGLGDEPIADLFSLLELRLGLRLYERPLNSSVSGLFAFDLIAGGCILINSNHPITRRRFSAGHELGHFMGTRHEPEILADHDTTNSKAERYANGFANAFLLPAASLKKSFLDLTAGQRNFTRRHVILLARIFGVSREALVRRLERIKVVKEGTWDWFQQNGGITDSHDRAVQGHDGTGINDAWDRALLPMRLSLLTREVWKQELYSEGQLARLLQLSRQQIRVVLDGAELENVEADDATMLLDG